MHDRFRKTAMIAILAIAVIGTAAAAQACMPEVGTGSTASWLHPANPFTTLKETCTREAMDQCEFGCMMPGGILDLNCYEDCIYSIC